jgi:hypothetical protein
MFTSAGCRGRLALQLLCSFLRGLPGPSKRHTPYFTSAVGWPGGPCPSGVALAT